MRWIDAVKLAGIAIAASFIVAVAVISRQPLLPKHRVTGVVTAIIPANNGRFRTPTMYVMVRVPHAMRGYAVVPIDDGRCEVGDRIDAVQQGVAIRPDPSSCASPGK
jgi:hypothetical protein